jgi:hypothetical protein
MSAEDRTPFLARWSRRKLAEPDLKPAPDAVAEAAPEAAPEAPKPPATCPIPGGPEIDLASLPKLEEMTVASDLGPFLRPGVPAALRDAALRRMWSLDPAIRDYIGPVEYQWDFNAPGGLPFGFSNELAGDVGKLLQQAIGMIPAEKRPELPPEPALDLEAPEDPAPERLEEREPPAMEAEALPTPRRRRGAALPVRPDAAPVGREDLA